MFIKKQQLNRFLANTLLAFLCLFIAACGKEATAENARKSNDETKVVKTTNSTDTTAKKDDNKTAAVEEISWDKLIPDDYDPNEAVRGYIEKLDKLQDGDQEAMELYGKIQAILDNAPVNKSLDGKTIKMPGFVAPLENNNGVIDEFLLVPYFGACIHSPPPPMNQTVMVKASKGKGIKSEASNEPVWITGVLKAVEERTSIGAAGYRIENPKIEPYEEPIN